MIDAALEALVADLARGAGVGAVGVIPSQRDEPARLMVAGPFEAAETFARALADKLGRQVQLYSFERLPYTHPFFVLVRWLNVIQLPTRPVPRGAVVRTSLRAGAGRVAAVVELDKLPHFRASDEPVALGAGESCRVLSAPPLGGFLI